MEQMKNLGSMDDMPQDDPGMTQASSRRAVDEKQMARTKAIIQSMTKAERKGTRIS
jgi:signal recognition particle GTPase